MLAEEISEDAFKKLFRDVFEKTSKKNSVV